MTLDQLIASVAGPSGAVALLTVIVVMLWRDHVRSDADVRAQRDTSVAVSSAQVAATSRLADLIEERDRAAAGRRRDAG